MSVGARRRGARSLRLSIATVAAVLAVASGAAAKVPGNFFGVVTQTSLSKGDFQRMSNAKVGTLRFTMLWSSIQRNRNGSYGWGYVDSVVRHAARRGIHLLPVLFGTPAFATNSYCESRSCSVRLPVKTKLQRNSWRQFVRAAVTRYGPGGAFWAENPYVPVHPIERWQIWNEENNARLKAPPGQYATLLGITRDAMTDVDPKSKLVLGGLAGNVTPGHKHTTAWDYLAGIYKKGSKSTFSAVALHPYSDRIGGVKHQIERMRRVMRRHGDSKKSLDVTEIGWGSGRPQVHHQFVKTPKGQKKRLKQSFKLVRDHRKQWSIGGIDWFSWKDPAQGKGLCGFCYSAGLLTHHNKPKPALSAFEHFTGG